MPYPMQNKTKKSYRGYQDMTESQTDDPLAAITRYQQPGMPMPRSQEDHYRQLLDGDFSSPTQAPRDSYNPATNQLLAGLAESANKLGTLGGKHADSGEVGRFADVLAKSHAAREQQQQQAMQRRQNILTKLAELRDKQNEAGTKSQLQRDLSGEKIASQEKLAREKMAHDTKMHGMKKEAEPKLTPGQTRYESKGGEELAKWDFGDRVTASVGIKKIKDVINKINKTGAGTGLQAAYAGDWLNSLSEGGQQGIDIRETIHDVVQNRLKAILGGQFTEKEGDRVLKTAFNPAVGKERTEARLKRLLQAMEQAFQAKEAASEQFKRTGKIIDFPRITADDLINDMEGHQIKSATNLEDLSDEELLELEKSLGAKR